VFRPNTPLQASFNLPQSPKPFERVQPDPLFKVLDAVPYQTRLINGVPSLTLLEQKFHALRIPELELPVVSDTLIHTRLDGLYKIRGDLYIHLNGGPLVKVTTSIGEKKKQKVSALLEDVSAEIGLYEEFVKKGIFFCSVIKKNTPLFFFINHGFTLANYLSLENILNESDSSDIEDFPDSLEGDSNHFVSTFNLFMA
jgi:hypothetical protein